MYVNQLYTQIVDLSWPSHHSTHLFVTKVGSSLVSVKTNSIEDGVEETAKLYEGLIYNNA